MFDISFAELMIIAIVGLLVIGPDKLPQVARTLGAYVGRLQRYVAQVKEEVSREARFEDLSRLQEEIKQGASQVRSSIMDSTTPVQETMDRIENSVKPKRQIRKSNKKELTETLPNLKSDSPQKRSTKQSATQAAIDKPVKKAGLRQKVEKV